MVDKYILENKIVVPCEDLIEWATWFERGDRRVADTTIKDIRVSTVFLGLDHSYNDNNPLVFETMVFGGENDQDYERCSTWEQAEAQHKRMCEAIEKDKNK